MSRILVTVAHPLCWVADAWFNGVKSGKQVRAQSCKLMEFFSSGPSLACVGHAVSGL